MLYQFLLHSFAYLVSRFPGYSSTPLRGDQRINPHDMCVTGPKIKLNTRLFYADPKTYSENGNNHVVSSQTRGNNRRVKYLHPHLEFQLT